MRMDNQEQQGSLREPKLVGGIPLNFEEISKKPGGKTVVKGLSGQLINITVGLRNIEIEPQGIDVYLKAKVETDENQKNYLRFLIRAISLEDTTEERSPDFYAKRLADEAIDYFGKKYEISGIFFDWLPYSDNYKRYFKLKEKFIADFKSQGKSDSEREYLAKQKAALGTWTGTRLAQPHGFTKVEIAEEEEKIEQDQTLGEGEKPAIIVRGKFYK